MTAPDRTRSTLDDLNWSEWAARNGRKTAIGAGFVVVVAATVFLYKSSQDRKESFAAHLAPEQRGWLDELAPVSIPWLDGKMIKLLYSEETDPVKGEAVAPEAQVKLQECFPLPAHPLICEGVLPVKLWLCAPDGKRIEATLNWPSFKANSYPKLKSALQKKFPGVPWV